MSSYPLVTDLPLIVETSNWEWKPFKCPAQDEKGFFEGVDESGDRWLTKMRGSFYAYREIVFERLVQRWLVEPVILFSGSRKYLPSYERREARERSINGADIGRA